MDSSHLNGQHTPSENFNQDQAPQIIPLVWMDAETGNIVQTREHYAMQHGQVPSFDNTPAPQAPKSNEPTLYDLNIEKTLSKGRKAHGELQERLNKGEKRYEAIKAISGRLNRPAYHIENEIKTYVQHNKRQKDKEFRATIIAGMQSEKTDIEMAKELGVHPKTIASKRRSIEQELLHGAI